ncbi:MAG TPA: hypothetical protein VHQ20_01455 [Patescibacteria group bacterium]|jgi:hypothetical protein|nr:hypothetical protein [Patescibacteria group bacterium]
MPKAKTKKAKLQPNPDIDPGLIHAWPQSQVYGDGKTFYHSDEEFANEKTNGRYWPTKWPHKDLPKRPKK